MRKSTIVTLGILGTLSAVGLYGWYAGWFERDPQQQQAGRGGTSHSRGRGFFWGGSGSSGGSTSTSRGTSSTSRGGFGSIGGRSSIGA